MNKIISAEVNKFKTFLLDNKISWLEIEPSKYVAEFKDIIVENAMYDVSFHDDGEVSIYKFPDSDDYVNDRKAINYSLHYNLFDDNFLLKANIKRLSRENDGDIIEDNIELLKGEKTVYKRINDICAYHDIPSDDVIDGTNSYIGEILNDNLNILDFKFDISEDNLLVNGNIHFYSRFKDYIVKREYNITANELDGIIFGSRYNYATGIGSRYNSTYYNSSKYVGNDVEYLYDNIDSGVDYIDEFLNDFIISLGYEVRSKNPNSIYIPYNKEDIDTGKLLEFDKNFDIMTDEIMNNIPFKDLDINRRIGTYIDSRSNHDIKKRVKKKD